jgi:hypothetical protein
VNNHRWLVDGVAAVASSALATLLVLMAAMTYGITREQSVDLPGLLNVDVDAKGFEVMFGRYVPLAVLGGAVAVFIAIRAARAVRS